VEKGVGCEWIVVYKVDQRKAIWPSNNVNNILDKRERV